MISIPELHAALLDHLFKLKETMIELILGGGYVIYLKRQYVQQHKERTLLSEIPEARSTNDLDLFLRPELIIQSNGLKPLKEALKSLGYKPIPEARYFQFAIIDPTSAEKSVVKIYLLTGP